MEYPGLDYIASLPFEEMRKAISDFITEDDKGRIRFSAAANYILFKRYPFLQVKSSWNGEACYEDDEVFSHTMFDCFPSGWLRAFGMEICEDFRNALYDADPDIWQKNLDGMFFEQIKEKYGSLRLYHAGGNELTFALEEIYLSLSELCCISCGSFEKVRLTHGWISPFCFDCDTDSMKADAIRNIRDGLDAELGWCLSDHIAKMQLFLKNTSAFTRQDSTLDALGGYISYSGAVQCAGNHIAELIRLGCPTGGEWCFEKIVEKLKAGIESTYAFVDGGMPVQVWRDGKEQTQHLSDYLDTTWYRSGENNRPEDDVSDYSHASEDEIALFCDGISAGSKILVIGYGDGADTEAFLGRGYNVDIAEPSKKTALIAAGALGKKILLIKPEEYEPETGYDGIFIGGGVLPDEDELRTATLEKWQKAVSNADKIYIVGTSI